jgi:hypothetical protein
MRTRAPAALSGARACRSESIRQRYEELEREKMALMIAQQRQQVGCLRADLQ